MLARAREAINPNLMFAICCCCESTVDGSSSKFQARPSMPPPVHHTAELSKRFPFVTALIRHPTSFEPRVILFHNCQPILSSLQHYRLCTVTVNLLQYIEQHTRLYGSLHIFVPILRAAPPSRLDTAKHSSRRTHSWHGHQKLRRYQLAYFLCVGKGPLYMSYPSARHAYNRPRVLVSCGSHEVALLE